MSSCEIAAVQGSTAQAPATVAVKSTPALSLAAPNTVAHRRSHVSEERRVTAAVMLLVAPSAVPLLLLPLFFMKLTTTPVRCQANRLLKCCVFGLVVFFVGACRTWMHVKAMNENEGVHYPLLARHAENKETFRRNIKLLMRCRGKKRHMKRMVNTLQLKVFCGNSFAEFGRRRASSEDIEAS